MEIRLGSRILDLGSPIVMGVLNVTPDSFSDGGNLFSDNGISIDHDAAMRQVEIMQKAGAMIIDVGGESTRPGAEGVPESEEIDRVVPIIEKISDRSDVAISVDTNKPDVMRAAVEAGASMINDVYALRQEGAMEAALELDVAICLMHMQGAPSMMQDQPNYQDISGDILEFMSRRLAACRSSGISADRIVIDPGFGFGKTHKHNVQLLAKLEQFQKLEVPLLIGLSRKSTLGYLTGKDVENRLSSGIAAAVIAVQRGANIVRTHDVESTVDALKIVHAIMQVEKEQ
jgi:dihydropteroate synthase